MQCIGFSKHDQSLKTDIQLSLANQARLTALTKSPPLLQPTPAMSSFKPSLKCVNNPTKLPLPNPYNNLVLIKTTACLQGLFPGLSNLATSPRRLATRTMPVKGGKQGIEQED